MQAKELKRTKITLGEGQGVAVTSTLHGANIDAIAFNLDFIGIRKPRLALEVVRIYQEASKLKMDDPIASESEAAEAIEALQEFHTDFEE